MSTPNKWFLKTNTGKIHGPYSELQIRETLFQGRFEAGSLIRQGNSRWFTLAELTEVFTRLAESGWYLAEVNGEVSGPFTLPRLKSLLAGRDCSRLQVCQGTSGNWILANQWLQGNVEQPRNQQVTQPVVISSKGTNSPSSRRTRRRRLTNKVLTAVTFGFLLSAVAAGFWFVRKTEDVAKVEVPNNVISKPPAKADAPKVEVKSGTAINAIYVKPQMTVQLEEFLTPMQLRYERKMIEQLKNGVEVTEVPIEIARAVADAAANSKTINHMAVSLTFLAKDPSNYFNRAQKKILERALVYSKQRYAAGFTECEPTMENLELGFQSILRGSPALQYHVYSVTYAQPQYADLVEADAAAYLHHLLLLWDNNS